MFDRRPFTYVITIHNKESILADVLAAVRLSAGHDARIVPVLDGCTDRSEAIAREFASKSDVETLLTFAPDVHEIRSINIGLRQALPNSYVVVLQDDVILKEPDLERRVRALCLTYHHRIGYLSFRLAANVELTNIFRRLRVALKTGIVGFKPLIRETDLISGPVDHCITKHGSVAYYDFQQRMVGIKSPVCLTPELRAVEPLLDEDLAPYCFDDYDLSIRALRSGMINGLYPIPIQSEVDWGGTRRDPDFSGSVGARIKLRNLQLLGAKHGEFLRQYAGSY